MLKRACRFLRVVQNHNGEIDALDQPDDRPSNSEKLFAYEIIDQPGVCHLNISGGRGGFYPSANYRILPDQPTQKLMANNLYWTVWCEGRGAKYPRPDLK